MSVPTQKHLWSQWRAVLSDRDAAWTFSILGIQQTIAASSNLWLSRTAERVASHGGFAFPLALYLLSMTVVYGPAFLIDVRLQKWSFSAVSRLVAAFVRTHGSRIRLWGDAQEKATRTSMLASEGPAVIQQTIRFSFDVLQIAANVLLNVGFVAIASGWQLALAYILSFAVMAVAVTKSGPMVSRAAASSQNARVNLNAQLLTAWDNVLLGNVRNLSRWNSSLELRFEESRTAQVRETRLASAASILTSLVGMVPVFATVVWLTVENAHDFARLAALLALLPRHVQILGNLEGAVSYANSWFSTKAHLVGVSALVTAPSVLTRLEDRIHWHDISVKGVDGVVRGLHTVGDFIEFIAEKKSGRWTITGPNGAGKSSLLVVLKDTLGGRAIYLPAVHALCFVSDSGRKSTGERMIEVLTELERDHLEDVILWDEWDAHLDSDNKRRMSEALDELAASRLVVEVRHFGDGRAQ